MKRNVRNIFVRYWLPIAIFASALLVANGWFALRDDSVFSFHALCPFSPVCFFFTLPHHGVVWPWGFFFFGALLIAALFVRRLFCGWLCPIGVVQDILSLIRRFSPGTSERPASSLRRATSYATRLMVLAATFTVPFGTGVIFFTRFCPMIRIGDVVYRTDITGGLATLVLFGVLSIAMNRFFCRFICPLGLVLGWMGRLGARFLPTITVHRTCHAGEKCARCSAVCPMKIDLCAAGTQIDDTECILCLRCLKTCCCYTLRGTE